MVYSVHEKLIQQPLNATARSDQRVIPVQYFKAQSISARCHYLCCCSVLRSNTTVSSYLDSKRGGSRVQGPCKEQQEPSKR